MICQKHFFSIIERFKGTKILCVGDLMLDIFTYGDVSRVSPEAPVPVLKVSHEKEMLGGAGNVVNNLLALGAQPILVGAVGPDNNGDTVKKILLEKGVGLDGLISDAALQTIEKRRFTTRGQQLLRVDREETAYFPDALYDGILNRALEKLKDVSGLILSDYGKGLLHPQKVIRPLIDGAAKLGIPIVVDPKGADYSIYKGTTVITPNRKELNEATKLPTKTDEEVIEAGATLIDTCGIQNVLATRSEDGMTLIQADKDAHHFKTQVKEISDVSGAGDTVIAVLTAALGTGASLKDAAYLSNVAGSIVVGKLNTATVSDLELKEACTHQTQGNHTKVMSEDRALGKIKSWHEKGLKVGFTNGCFDILHEGHITIFKEADMACDRLIVGINSDASVKRLKGNERPINDEKTRALIVSCLAFVDAVVIFHEDTPLNLIKSFQPDVLIKGDDYKKEDVVGGDIVEGKGGRVVLVDLVKGKSTTNIVNKLKG